MKPRLWLSLVLFVSAYAPLALLFAVRDIDVSLPPLWLKHPAFVLGVIALAGLSVAILAFVINRFEGQFVVTVKTVSHCSKDFVEYSIPYIISFFSVDFGKWQDVAALGIFMGLLFLLAMKTQSLFLNPLLALWDYQLYEVEFQESGTLKAGVFLAKIELKREGTYRIGRVNRFLYIATDKIKRNQK